MGQHASRKRDALAEVRLEQPHEGAAVPCCEPRHTSRARAVGPDAILVEARPVFVIVEVVGLGQLCKETAAVSREGTTGEQFLEGRVKAGWSVVRDAAENTLAFGAEIRPEQREQLDHGLVRYLARH